MKAGDVVCLNSGGYLMTVEGVQENDNGIWVYCVWFADNEVKRQSFPSQLLTVWIRKNKT